MDRGGWWTTVHRVTEADLTEVTDHTCTHVHIYAIAATGMNPEIIILSEVSQTERDKYHKI